MAKFAKNVVPKEVAATQAANVMKQLQGNVLKSSGTVHNYENRLTQVAEIVNRDFLCGLRELTVEQAHQYLTDRGAEVGQKTLDMERQAIQCMMRYVTGQLEVKETLEVIKSEYAQILTSRSYTPAQVQRVADAQNDRNGLATEISYAAGLRAHELHTLRRLEERPADIRETHEAKFSGRDGVSYTVHGKGGLIREVVIPKELSDRLEERRLDEPKHLVDRGVNYQSHYDIAGGKNWSNSFSAASNRALGWSAGAHGMRHSYAQERMSELQKIMVYEQALKVVSLEMGHIRAGITEVYLR